MSQVGSGIGQGSEELGVLHLLPGRLVAEMSFDVDRSKTLGCKESPVPRKVAPDLEEA